MRVDILCDDDEISIGHGTGSHVWPVDALPAPGQVDWQALHDVSSLPLVSASLDSFSL